MVDWLAEQIEQQCRPHGLPLEGDGGLLAALAAAARNRLTSEPSEPVKIELTYDPIRQEITADLEPGTTMQMLVLACLGVAHTAADLHPFVAIRQDGTTIRRA